MSIYIKKNGECIYLEFGETFQNNETQGRCIPKLDPYLSIGNKCELEAGFTVRDLLSLMEKNPFLQAYAPIYDDIINEQLVDEGQYKNHVLEFCHYDFLELGIEKVALEERMHVSLLSEENERFSCIFVSVKEILDCKININPLVSSESEKVCLPSLFNLIYSLFFELSFCGKPEDRKKQLEELEESVKECNLTEAISVEDFFKELRGLEDDSDK